MMIKSLPLIFLVLSCSSTEVRQVGTQTYKPLSEDAPVQVFSKHYPDLHYEKICEIDLERDRSFTSNILFSDYYDDIKKEARKCGANGVLIKSGLRIGNKFNINAIGIKITSENKKISQDNIKKLSLAAQSDNLPALEKLLENVNSKRYLRAPSDTELIDGLFYVYSRKGIACKNNMVSFFESMEAIIPQFNYVPIYRDNLSDENIIFCKNVLVKSFPHIQKKDMFAIDLNNHFVRFIKYLRLSEDNLTQKLESYHNIFKKVTKEIARTCSKNETDPLCIIKSNFSNHGALLKKAMMKLRTRDESYNKLRQLDQNFESLPI